MDKKGTASFKFLILLLIGLLGYSTTAWAHCENCEMTLPHGIIHPGKYFQGPHLHSVKSGAWSDPTTWDVGRVPSATDLVHINSTHAVLLDSPDAVADTVVIENDGRLDFKTNANV